MAKKGSKVHLIISAGEESIRVNDVIGQSENTAVNRLQDQGFSVYVTREYNESSIFPTESPAFLIAVFACVFVIPIRYGTVTLSSFFS